MAAQPPSLPYIRDEASTSQQVSYPSYPHEEYDHDMDMDGELEEEDTENAAMFQFWTAKRHMGRKGKNKAADEVALPWRLRSRLKTVNAGLFLCLNIGVDPPDIVKTNPCAKTECWVDPSTLPSTKAIEAIGRSEPKPSIPHVPQWLTNFQTSSSSSRLSTPRFATKFV
jgi:regulator-associated protein of mTOR